MSGEQQDMPAKQKTKLSGFQMGMDGRGDVASYKAGNMIAKVVGGGQSSVHISWMKWSSCSPRAM